MLHGQTWWRVFGNVARTGHMIGVDFLPLLDYLAEDISEILLLLV